MNIDKEQSRDDNDISFQDLTKLTKNKISCSSKLIKDNITVIVLIPTVLGGLIQILKLGMMDLRYIRYFSVTQLIPDGLLAILMLCIVTLIVYVHNNFLLQTIPSVSDNLKENLSNTRFIIHSIIAIGMTVTVTNAFIDMPTATVFLSYPKQGIISYVGVLALAYFNIRSILFNLHLIRNGNFLSTFNRAIKDIAKFLFAALGCILTIGLVLISLRMAHVIIEYINEPKGIYNYSRIEETIISDFGEHINYKILYFNDKYTFVEINVGNSNITTIYKTDNVFFNPTTIEVK